MSHRRKKDVLNETWTKDDLSKSLKKRSDKKSSHHSDKYDRRGERIDEEKYLKKEKRRDDREDSRRKSHSDRKHDSGGYEERGHGNERREKRERHERREKESEKYYTMNGEKKHRRERDEEHREHKSKKSERQYLEDDDNDRRRHKDERHRGERRRTSGKERTEDEDRRRHRDEYGDERRHHKRDRERDGERHSSGKHHTEDDSERRHRRHKEEKHDSRERERQHKSKGHNRDRRERHRDESDGDDDKYSQGYEKKHKRREEDERERHERKERHRRERDEEYERRKRREHDKENRSDKRREDKKHSRSSKHNRYDTDEDEDARGPTTSSSKHDSTYLVERDTSSEVKNKLEDEYNYDDEEFEDYADDFEDDASEHEDVKIKPRADSSASKASEMEELMQAIAAENERANSAHTSSRFGSTMTSDRNESPFSDQGSSTSDNRDTSSASGSKPGQSTVINFMAAKSKSVDSKTKKRVIKRSRDLMNLIQLDTISFDLIDMPPVTEYNLYIKNFGNSNTAQVSTQCKDDNLEQETQTEVSETVEKWSQHPPHDVKASGGVDSSLSAEESQNEERERMLAVMRGDSKRLGRFLFRSCKLIESILIEDELWEKSQAGSGRKSKLSFCENFVGLETNLPYLQGRRVVHVECSPGTDVNLVAVVFEPAATTFSTRIDRKGIVAVWDTRKPTIPEKILVCDASPTCCCFSPIRSYVLFVGTDDACVLAYDLREPGIWHQIVNLEPTRETVLRNPTYTTGFMMDGHSSPIVSVTPIGSESKVTQDKKLSVAGSQADENQSHTGLAFQLASLEEAANLCIWVVVELLTESDLDSDIGLAPHGRIKLVKSSSIRIRAPIKSPLSDVPFRTTCVQFSFSDPNHFYIGTDTGHVVHCTQYSDAAQRKGVITSNNTLTFYNDLHLVSSVTCLDINPFQCFGASLMLVGYDDGGLRLYLSDRELPVLSWPFSTSGAAVARVQWSTSRPSVFFVLDAKGHLHIWDAAILNSGPIKTEQSDRKQICNFCLSNTAGTSVKRSPEVALVYEASSNSEPSLVEVHKLAPHFSQITDENEMEQLTALLQSMI